MGILVIGATFVDIKGFPYDKYIPTGRNSGRIEYVHGGVARNVAEDIANMELRPTFVTLIDETPLGKDVKEKLAKHKVNTDYIITEPDGMGIWMVVFNNDGDVAGSISKRPDLLPMVRILEEKGDEMFSQADSVVIEVDIEKEILKPVLKLAKKHNVRLYGMVTNMSIATERRDFIQNFECFICNQQEAGLLFVDDYSEKTPEELRDILAERIRRANIKSMIVTMGEKGSVYADIEGNRGVCAAKKVAVKDTTGAGDAFCAGIASALTYGKTLPEAMDIGSFLAASVITSSENVCPRFLPQELGIDVNIK